MRLHRTLGVVLALGLGVMSGCGAMPTSYGWSSDNGAAQASPAQVRVRWMKRLTPRFGSGSYVPVERAQAGLDPARNRIYVGTSEGDFFAFNASGRRMFRYRPESPVAAAPAVDRATGQVYLAAEDGIVHAFQSGSSDPEWKESAGGAVRQPPVLSEDAVYVVTEDDKIAALSRETGELLWDFTREIEAEYFIAGHAGLVLHGEKLLTAFSDGTVIALDASDGSLLWERPTQLDVDPEAGDPVRFYDVDTTPVVVDDTVYVAGIRAGLYALDLSNGSVRWRDGEQQGVVGLASQGRFLVATSAEDGVTVIDRETREQVWRREVRQGAPGQPVISGNGIVLVGESQGSLLAFDLRSGANLGRIHTGGFAAPAALAGRFGWALSNGGQLIALEL